MVSRLFAVALVSSLEVVLWSPFARAGEKRTRFEPTDLELEDPGVLDIDVQIGAVRGPTAARMVLPDAEIDLGLAPEVEIDLDFALGIEGPDVGPYKFDHLVADNVWLSSKLGLWSSDVATAKTSWALGVQFGPKLPAAPAARGIGYEALALLGRRMGGTHLVLNAGGLVDPGVAIDHGRPFGIEVGIDLDQDLDEKSTFSILGEIGAAHFFTSDPDIFTVSLGFQYSPSELLDLSVVGLAGIPKDGDRFGVLFGVSPKVKLF